MSVILILSALGMWTPAFVGSTQWWIPLITLLITAANAFLCVVFCYRASLTRMPSAVPAFLYLILVGAMPVWQEQWPRQILTLDLFLVLLLIQRAYLSRKDAHLFSATEEAFLSALLLGSAAIWYPYMLFFIVITLLVLLFTGLFSIRVFGALLIGVCTCALYCFLALHFNLISPQFPNALNWQWIFQDWQYMIAPAVTISASAFFLSKSSLTRGIIFTIYTVAILTLFVFNLNIIPI